MTTTLVLGAGVIGITSAYYLASSGRQVTVIDRQPEPANETSFANAGLIAPGHSYTWASPRAPGILLRSLYQEGQALRLKLRADPQMWAWAIKFLANCNAAQSRLNTSRKLVLCRYSQAQLQALTEKETLHYDRLSNGLLYLYRDAASFARGTANMQVLADGGMPLEVIDAARVVALEPALAQAQRHIAGAIHCPTDESGDARLFTQDLTERCRRLGVRFEFGNPIVRLEQAADRLSGVVTEQGRREADEYVLALGSYAPILARPLGYRLPVYPVKGYSVTFPSGEGFNPPNMGGVDENNLVAYARFGDRLRFTATAEFTGYRTDHSPADFAHMLAAGRELFPNGADYERPRFWAGLRPMTPEGTPIIGRSHHRNLFLNVGHGHMGWTMSCGSARILTDVMNGQHPEIDLTGMTLV
ncbi:D-amino acid dehydrogenase [Pseudomonas typographi]|uniref:D-amino acid dehydrogenase n=1 Tax=Pseudomonas typographi TaxID=2715964 RepID=UPI001684DD68|nr:D-amino acid dehydrogenase [Pseudomonas typographi]MBD1552680.1 D-amino acid dehydrogenase [Pseudomonas typographi]MBD1588161.1 D-amino acid dehydrogenase [Pseudomonas typographi]